VKVEGPARTLRKTLCPVPKMSSDKGPKYGKIEEAA
jgi:hypothetical protein